MDGRLNTLVTVDWVVPGAPQVVDTARLFFVLGYEICGQRRQGASLLPLAPAVRPWPERFSLKWSMSPE